jgi:hypothetical protein
MPTASDGPQGLPCAAARPRDARPPAAATSLAHLRRDHGKRAQARDLLASVYDWFTEGFSTPVLKEAKTLLEGA